MGILKIRQYLLAQPTFKMLAALPIRFDPAAHKYQWQPTGEWLAFSVTGIKAAGITERQKLAFTKTRHIWEPRGCGVHAALEDFLLGRAQAPTEFNEWIEPLLDHSFWDRVEPIAVEYRLCDLANSIGGSCDCLLKDKLTGKYLLCDLKTQGNILASTYSTDAQMGGYLSMFLQHHPAIEISECLTVWSRPGKAFITRKRSKDCLAAWEKTLAEFKQNHLTSF
jgi:hypothetical protein